MDYEDSIFALGMICPRKDKSINIVITTTTSTLPISDYVNFNKYNLEEVDYEWNLEDTEREGRIGRPAIHVSHVLQERVLEGVPKTPLLSSPTNN